MANFFNWQINRLKFSEKLIFQTTFQEKKCHMSRRFNVGIMIDHIYKRIIFVRMTDKLSVSREIYI